MRRYFILAATVAVSACATETTAPVAAPGSALFASNYAPARYQVTTTNYDVVVDPVSKNLHPYVITNSNPCNNTTDLTITGSYPLKLESVTGSVTGGIISIRSDYGDGSGYWYTTSFSESGGPLLSFASSDPYQSFTGNVTRGATTTSDYKNHGEYVAANPDKNDAAHSCIGMPIQGTSGNK